MRYAKFNPCLNSDGLIEVGGRTERWMEATWNKQKFILLPSDHKVSELIIRYEHDKTGHLGIAATVAMIRSKYWIIKIKKGVKREISGCVECKIKYERLASQIMCPLPEERLKPTPPFYYIAVDYFGPFTIRGEVQKRTRGKCYGVILTCMSSRAVHLDIADNLSTDGFLQLLRRYASLRGWPKKIFSDNGTQLVSASKELQSIIKNLDWDEVQKFGYKYGTEWSFSPADAPWYNGAAEALIKSVKRALSTAVGEQIMTFSEFQTYIFEAAQLVNQRPIGVNPSNPDDGTYICPNDLILGRASPSVPQGPFKERCSQSHRLDFIQNLVNAFWKKWSRDVFPLLVPRPKWHTDKRDCQKGDVVLIQDSNLVRGQWKRGIIIEVMPSKDGRVRRVRVECRTDSTRRVLERAVQKLIVLVPVSELGGGNVQFPTVIVDKHDEQKLKEDTGSN